MKRDYCEEHDDLANTDQFAEGRVCHYWSHQVTLEREYGKDDSLTPCRMVPMRLIPDNAEQPLGPRCPRCHGSGIDEGASVLDGETPTDPATWLKSIFREDGSRIDALDGETP